MGELLTEQNCKSGSLSWSCFWGKAVGCHDTSASGKKTFQLQPIEEVGEIWTSPAAKLVFSQAPCSREYKWRNWDMTFSLTGKESTDNEWTSLWLQALLGKKRQILSAMEIKIPHHFILSCHTEQMQCLVFFRTTFQMAIRFLNRKSTVPSTDTKITASSYYLVTWKIFDWGNKVLHWRAWVISCRQKKQN